MNAHIRIAGEVPPAVFEMDGNMDIPSQIRLMRSVIGRKIMEIDEYNDKAAEMTGDEAAKFVDMIDFLKNDIAGYKTIVDDLKDGTCDYTGDLYDIASLPEASVELYDSFYLPMLSDEDRSDEEAAMSLKGQYAVDLVNSYAVKLGKMALSNPIALGIMSSNDSFLAAVGKMVLSDPELQNALKEDQGNPQ